MSQNSLPKQDCDIANILFTIGLVYYKMKKYNDALTQFFDALKIYEKTLPRGHRRITNVFGEIVRAYKAMGNYPTAFGYCERKLGELRENLGKTHCSVGRMLLIMGEIHLDYKEHKDAFSYFQKAQIVFEKCIPPEKIQLKHCLNQMALVCHKQHDFKSSLKYLMKMLVIARKIYAPNHLEIARTLRSIGVTYTNLKNYHQAMAYLSDALILYKEKFSNDHEEVKKITSEIMQLKQLLMDK
jgi:tetratricopeptide (TPR) repeat protein